MYKNEKYTPIFYKINRNPVHWKIELSFNSLSWKYSTEIGINWVIGATHLAQLFHCTLLNYPFAFFYYFYTIPTMRQPEIATKTRLMSYSKLMEEKISTRKYLRIRFIPFLVQVMIITFADATKSTSIVKGHFRNWIKIFPNHSKHEIITFNVLLGKDT